MRKKAFIKKLYLLMDEISNIARHTSATNGDELYELAAERFECLISIIAKREQENIYDISVKLSDKLTALEKLHEKLSSKTQALQNQVDYLQCERDVLGKGGLGNKFSIKNIHVKEKDYHHFDMKPDLRNICIDEFNLLWEYKSYKDGYITYTINKPNLFDKPMEKVFSVSELRKRKLDYLETLLIKNKEEEK